MRLSSKILAGVVALLVLLGSTGLFYVFVRADSDTDSWFSAADPSLQTVASFPDNQKPTRQNRDCVQMTYTTTEHQTESDCMVQTALGLMSAGGGALLYHDTSLAIPIVGYAGGNYSLMPVPNQGLVISLSSAPVMGFHLHFYTNLLGNVSIATSPPNNMWYTVNALPDVSFPAVGDGPIAANPYTISFSSDGTWMIVEDMQYGMLRINLATLQVLPFAQALNTGPSDYRTRSAATAISDDGRYAVVASNDFHYFKVFDLSTCTLSTAHPSFQSCQSRDLWPYAAAQANLQGIYSVRFTNDDNINFDATYDFNSLSDYRAGRFNITVPGGQARGLDYLAMGDSYISGQGTFVYEDGTDTANNTCHLSSLSYPYIIGAELPQINSYESVACSGATTNDIRNTSESYKGQVRDNIEKRYRNKGQILSSFSPGYVDQLDFVKAYQPRIITLSVGGDDIDFADIVKACVTPLHPNPDDTCFGSYAKRLGLAKSVIGLYAKLSSTYQAILNTDPGVQLYVIGYPQIAASDGICAANVHLNGQEIQFSQQLIGFLDSTIERASSAAGARYVDVQHAFDGHRLCEAQSGGAAVNGFTTGNDGGALGVEFIGSESYHPNQLGHRLLAQEILQQTHNFTDAMPSSGPVVVPSMNDPLAQALLNGYQSAGSPIIDDAGFDFGMAESLVHGGESIVLDLPGLAEGLDPDTPYEVLAHSDPTELGTITTDADGNLRGSVTVPPNLPPGFHTLHVYGPNRAGEQIDIYKVIYVAASDDDYNGDGVPNTADQCLLVPLSGQDIDQDGIDDACDPVIGNPPAHSYPATATLKGNTILITNSGE